MYILGDVINRGPESWKLLIYIRQHGNMILLKGNHEWALCEHLRGNLSERLYKAAYDGAELLKQVAALNEIEKKSLQFYLSELPCYIKLSCGTILTHAGIWLDSLVDNEDGSISVEKSIQAAEEKMLLHSIDLHCCGFHVIKRLDTNMMVGHYTAVSKIHTLGNGKVICLDTDWSTHPSCLRMEDRVEFYL